MSERPFEPEYIGFWSRVLAAIVDSIAVTLSLAVILIPVFGADGLFLLNATEEQLRSQLIQLAVNAAFVLGFWFLLSTTPGKLVINAYIVDAKTLGKPRPWQLVVRYLGYYLSILTLMLGFLWVAFDRRKQGLHDKLAGTVVIRGKPVLNSRQDDA